MLWNYKTFHFSPKMRQMMYPDCKTTRKLGLDINDIIPKFCGGSVTSFSVALTNVLPTPLNLNASPSPYR